MADVYVPGAGARSGRSRWVLVGASLAVSALFAVAGFVGADVYDRWRAKAHAVQDDAVQFEVDEARVPFTTVVKRLEEPEDNPVHVIDRPFTPNELDELLALDLQDREDIDKFDSIMAARQVRYVKPPSFPTDMPTQVSVYQLDIHSERDNALTITGLEATDLRCADTFAAKTLIKFPSQGEITAAGMLLDLDSHPRDPINVDRDSSDQGKSYFSRHAITVGGSESPGLVRLEAATGKPRCSFNLKATFTYTDETHSTVITNNGKPFVSESVPERPEQELVFSIPDKSFVDCSQRWVPGCSDSWK
ncbi:hypothetical protein [Streptomyces cyaneus]|uniref:hypothetical protein n=1 Tax=Streptomyces cyaneus TaxID=1904 RepID=UPI000FF8B0F5|nr:hypothetical protein [Streptomyces cyaneus]